MKSEFERLGGETNAASYKARSSDGSIRPTYFVLSCMTIKSDDTDNRTPDSVTAERFGTPELPLHLTSTLPHFSYSVAWSLYWALSIVSAMSVIKQVLETWSVSVIRLLTLSDPLETDRLQHWVHFMAEIDPICKTLRITNKPETMNKSQSQVFRK
jgi:hypothetical protein